MRGVKGIRESFPVGNKKPWQRSSMVLFSNSGNSTEVSLLLKVMGATQGEAGGGSCCTRFQGRAKTTGCCRVLQPERCPRVSRAYARTARQQDAAEVSHLDQGQALCLSLVELELPGTRELRWVCAQQQGNKMCLSPAAHQGWAMPVFGTGEQESCLAAREAESCLYRCSLPRACRVGTVAWPAPGSTRRPGRVLGNFGRVTVMLLIGFILQGRALPQRLARAGAVPSVGRCRTCSCPVALGSGKRRQGHSCLPRAMHSHGCSTPGTANCPSGT